MKTPYKALQFHGSALVAALMLGSLGSALAADLTVKLAGDQEVPAVTTSATGTGTIVIKPDKSVSGSITTAGVAGTIAHIHLAAPATDGAQIISLVKTSEFIWAVPEGSTLTDDQF